VTTTEQFLDQSPDGDQGGDEGVSRVGPGRVSPYPGLVGVEQAAATMPRPALWDADNPVSDQLAEECVRRVPTLLSVARAR
jgi:hypothetical protein